MNIHQHTILGNISIQTDSAFVPSDIRDLIFNFKQVPHGYKGDPLLKMLLDTSVPILRATWYISILFTTCLTLVCDSFVVSLSRFLFLHQWDLLCVLRPRAHICLLWIFVVVVVICCLFPGTTQSPRNRVTLLFDLTRTKKSSTWTCRKTRRTRTSPTNGRTLSSNFSPPKSRKPSLSWRGPDQIRYVIYVSRHCSHRFWAVSRRRCFVSLRLFDT